MAEQNAAAQENQSPTFNIEKIYVKDASLEVPNAPQIYTNREAPQVGIELANSATKLDDGFFEVSIKATVTSKLGDTVVFLVEVDQGAVFQVRNVPEQDLEPILAIACPNILFPYVRETVSDLITRAGFPTVLLNPVNFEGLYMQQKQQQAQEAAGEATTH